MSVTVLFIAVAIVVSLILRATGDESVGFGGVLEVNDDVGDTFKVIPKVETLGVPNEVTGAVESKTLDLPNAVIQQLPTLKNGGTFTFKTHLISATRSRLEAIRIARSIKQWRVTIPCDTGTIAVTVPGFITQNQIEDLEAEKITVISTTVQVSGAQI